MNKITYYFILIIKKMLEHGGVGGGKISTHYWGSELCMGQNIAELLYWAIQRSWFARVNVLHNLSCKKP